MPEKVLKKVKGVRRLYFLKWKLDQAISIYKPNIAVIEDYAMGTKTGRSFHMGELGGVIKYLLFIRKISYYAVTPQQLKKYATGKGSGDKNVIMREVYKKWRVEFKTDDETDAFVLAQIGKGIEIYKKNKSKLLKYEQEVIEKVLADLTTKKTKKYGNWIREIK